MVADDRGVMRRYRLRKSHKINGVLHPAGGTVELPRAVGDWLCQQDIAEPTTGNATVIEAAQPSITLGVPNARVVRKCCGW